MRRHLLLEVTMRKIHIPALALAAVCLLSACDKAEMPVAPAPGEIAIITEPIIEERPKSDFITVKDEYIRITSLAVWEDFNHDGNFSDNCLNFLRNFIENDSEFLEFNSVKVSDFEIIRDPEQYDYYQLAFNFTVTESALDTLPAGEYRTIVNDIVDCYVEFENKDPRNLPSIPASAATDAVRNWIASAMRWEMPAYGEGKDPTRYINYLVRTYGKNGRMLYSDFEKLLKEKAGLTVTKEECDGLLRVEDAKLYIIEGGIGGNTAYSFVADGSAHGFTSVIVQFYAECNGFIRSNKVEYRIGDNGELLGSTVLEKSPYKPYGLQP